MVLRTFLRSLQKISELQWCQIWIYFCGLTQAWQVNNFINTYGAYYAHMSIYLVVSNEHIEILVMCIIPNKGEWKTVNPSSKRLLPFKGNVYSIYLVSKYVCRYTNVRSTAQGSEGWEAATTSFPFILLKLKASRLGLEPGLLKFKMNGAPLSAPPRVCMSVCACVCVGEYACMCLGVHSYVFKW